jgi:protein TonB
MSVYALHSPERPAFARWSLAAIVIVIAYAAIGAALVLWSARTPKAPNILAAVSVSLVPVQSSSPQSQDQDIAVGPEMQEAPDTPPQPPKDEPTPSADDAIPKPKPTQQSQPPAPQTTAPQKSDNIGQFSEAASNLYNSRVFGQLQRFKRYPAAAHGASGTVVVRFVLNRAGDVISSAVTQSSGNAVLDDEALAILRRASPFPAFPAVKPGEEDVFVAPVAFSR